MTCRSGCASKDHGSYAECLRAASIKVDAVINSKNQWMFEETKKDMRAYEGAKANGISPGGTSMAKVKQAQDATKLLGRPYDASADPPADLIVNKKTAKFANWKE